MTREEFNTDVLPQLKKLFPYEFKYHDVQEIRTKLVELFKAINHLSVADSIAVFNEYHSLNDNKYFPRVEDLDIPKAVKKRYPALINNMKFKGYSTKAIQNAKAAFDNGDTEKKKEVLLKIKETDLRNIVNKAIVNDEKDFIQALENKYGNDLQNVTVELNRWEIEACETY